MTDLKWLGTARGIAIQSVALTTLITGLLLAGRIGEATWAQMLQWLWTSYIGGAAVASFRDLGKPAG